MAQGIYPGRAERPRPRGRARVPGGPRRRARELVIDVADRPPEAVEVAAYYVVSEALTNIDKHAQATSARVHLSPGRVSGCRSTSATTAWVGPTRRR